MTIKEEDQFITDPIMYPNEEILVPQGWLQNKLRRLYAVEKELVVLKNDKQKLLESNSSLRRDILVLESKSPYTRLNVKV